MESSGGKVLLAAWAFVAITFMLVLALIWQALEVYLVFDGTQVHPNSSQSTRYVWTASLCGASAVAALVAATFTGKKGAIVMSVIALVAALGASVVLAVPQDRWHPQPERHPLPPNYDPCYSGSNECN